MDCKEFEKMIPAYIAKKLDYYSLKRFCEHAEQCEACKEELTIQYLTTEGIQRLEDGDAFDLQRELNQYRVDAKHKIRFHDAFLQMGLVFEIIAVLVIFGVILWILA